MTAHIRRLAELETTANGFKKCAFALTNALLGLDVADDARTADELSVT